MLQDGKKEAMEGGDVCCVGKDERHRVRAIVLGITVRYHRHVRTERFTCGRNCCSLSIDW
jgi:hypothetical protein